jgi:recombinational DNA repair protein (RecF pathway)
VDALLERASPPIVARYVEAWTLRLHGVLPELDACVSCGRPLSSEGGAWHWSLHGVACPRCVGKETGGVTLLPEDLAWLDVLRRRAPAEVPEPDARVMRRAGVFLKQALRDFMGGKELKSARFLEM